MISKGKSQVNLSRQKAMQRRQNSIVRACPKDDRETRKVEVKVKWVSLKVVRRIDEGPSGREIRMRVRLSVDIYSELSLPFVLTFLGRNLQDSRDH